MNRIVAAKLENSINQNLPLIKQILEEKVLPQISGSLKNRDNQALAFRLLYNNMPAPISLIRNFIKEEVFINFCLEHSEKLIGSVNSQKAEVELQEENLENELIIIGKLFIADELIKLKELLDLDVINIDEFNEKKRNLINID
jgi:hypothetical protein